LTLRFVIRTYPIVIFLTLAGVQCTAQFAGHVVSYGEAIPGAWVKSWPSGEQIQTDMSGGFILSTAVCDSLIVFAPGYFTRSIPCVSLQKESQIDLEPRSVELNQVVVTGVTAPVSVSASTLRVEQISKRHLTLFPARSVAEGLHFVNGLTDKPECAVCGSGQVQINGMPGAYTLVLIDGLPVMGALASVYGLSAIPVSLVDRVEVIKGPASTAYGSDALGGVINIFTRKPTDRNEVFIQMEYSSHQQGEWSGGWQGKLGRRGALLVMAHLTRHTGRIDQNDDGFTDVPLIQRLTGFVKWSGTGKMNVVTSLRVLDEERWGGELGWNNEYRGSDQIYGEYIRTRRLEWAWKAEPVKGWFAEGALANHVQHSDYGENGFNALQQNGFLHTWKAWNSGKHAIRMGATQRYLNYFDQTGIQSSEKRWIPGVYAQDEWKPLRGWSILGGLRMDLHQAHGLVWAPQLNIRYATPSGVSYRINSGKGFRYVNLFTEEHAALSGSRTIILEEQLLPEQSDAVQADVTRISNFGTSGVINASIGGFYTRFTNRILPDYFTDPGAIVYRNLRGVGFVRGFNADLSLAGSAAFRLTCGTTWTHSFDRLEDGTRTIQPLVPSWVHTATVWWQLNSHWECSWLIRHTGRMILPAHPSRESGSSSPFSQHHFQLRYACETKWSAWIGVRNVFNYTQPNPILFPQDPFSEQFDASSIYGPTQGRHLVVGISASLPTSGLKGTSKSLFREAH